jgi:hypothetical protein
MADNSTDGNTGLKLVVTGVAVALFAVRLLFPQVHVDAVSLGLLLLALLPWLSPLIKSAKLPGGIEIEFQDVSHAAQKVTASAVGPVFKVTAPTPATPAAGTQDANLALVGLRIEIENRLRELAARAKVPASRPLVQLTTDLQEAGVLEPQAASGLRDLISLGNQAAHGRKVAPDVALWAADNAPAVLRVLDLKLQLHQGSTGAP